MTEANPLTDILYRIFLNQARAGRTRAWFLKIDPVWTSVCVFVCVCVCVCVSAPEAINN